MSNDINEIELRRIDLNLLLVFSAVMRTGSAKAAASHLFVGPSAVSMALARLRVLVGEPLFVRVGSGLKPTKVAEELYATLQPALAAITTAIAERFDFDPSSSQMTFHIGMLDDFEGWFVPTLQRRVRTSAPNATIVVHAVTMQTFRDALAGGEVDVVMSANPLSRAAGLPNTKFFDEDFVVLTAAGAASSLSMMDYLALPHALVSVTGSEGGIIDQTLEQLGHRRRVSLVVQHFATLPFLIAEGALIATMPRAPAQILAERFGLTCRELPFASPTFGVGMIWHSRTEYHPPSAWFRAEIEAAMRLEK